MGNTQQVDDKKLKFVKNFAVKVQSPSSFSAPLVSLSILSQISDVNLCQAGRSPI